MNDQTLTATDESRTIATADTPAPTGGALALLDEKAPRPPSPPPGGEGSGFEAVLGDELKAIHARRVALDVENGSLASSGRALDDAWRARLLGVCFSGGGIRSATFNLGVLQALAHYGLLRHVDYLSTVSGGGYVGSWLTALSQRVFASAAPKEEQRSLADRARQKMGLARSEPEEHAALALPKASIARGPQGRSQSAEEPSSEGTRGVEQAAGPLEDLPPVGPRPFTAEGYEQFEREIAWSAGGATFGQKHDEHAAIRFLRQYSNYLTPKLGIFSGDTWALISIYVRNALLNFLVLVACLALVLLMPRWMSWALTHLPAGAPERETPWSVGEAAPWAVFVLAGMLFVAWYLGRNLAGLTDTDRAAPNAKGSLGVIATILVPVLLVGISAAAWLPELSKALSPSESEPGKGVWVAAALAGSAAGLLLWGVAYLAAFASPWWRESERPFWNNMLYYGVWSGMLFGVGMYAAGSMVDDLVSYSGFALIVAPPLLALGILTAGVVHVGLAGKAFGSQYSEWLSRLGGLMSIGAIGWIAITSLVFLGPVAVAALGNYIEAQIALGSGWFLTTLSALILGKTRTGPAPSFLLRAFMAVAPWIFIVGLLVILSAALQSVLDLAATHVLEIAEAESNGLFWANAGKQLSRIEDGRLLLGASAIALFLTVVLSRRIDINTFSLNSMYGNRLVRCYLGASVKERWANPFSGLSAQDDLSLFAMPKQVGKYRLWVHADAEGREPAYSDTDRELAAYPGPYHLVNTAINLVAGRSLAWQERKAGSFLLSPFYCGFHWRNARGGTNGGDEDIDAYRASKDFSSQPKHLTLGEAVATSGAAASPNMGFHSKAAFAFLMGVFNIRLGRWAGNPAKNDVWRDSGPRFALKYLLSEVFGLTNSDSKFVYLSDGGHFENLGLYELVRRRCRYIIVCDSGADEQYAFENLANAVRKCRIDLGVEIELDVSEIGSIDAKRFNAAPCAIGRVRYGDERVGTILYIKPSRLPGFPSDLLHYATEHPAFPHETTADQFFSESQFESYRRLGHYLATSIIGAAMPDIRPPNLDLDKLFRDLSEHWHRPSSPVDTNFTRLAHSVDAVFERLRTSERLAFLSRQFYPEWRSLLQDPSPLEQAEEMWLIPEDEEVFREAFYFCSSLIQLMENVYIDLNLETEWDHPDNAGWVNLFNHWTWSGMFRVTWAVAAATYGRRFRSFCQRRLGLELGDVTAVAVFERARSSELPASTLNVLERKQVNALLGRTPPEGDTVYALELRVRKPLTDDDTQEEERYLRSFGFGYAVLEGDELLMYRVQDHLRNMGLGRRGLKKLVELRAEIRQRIDIRHTAAIAYRLQWLGERVDEQKVADFCAMLASANEEVADERRRKGKPAPVPLLASCPADRTYASVEAGALLTLGMEQTGDEHSLHATLYHAGETLHDWRSEELEDKAVQIRLTRPGRYRLHVHTMFYGGRDDVPPDDVVFARVAIDGSRGREPWSAELNGRDARIGTLAVDVDIVESRSAALAES